MTICSLREPPAAASTHPYIPVKWNSPLYGIEGQGRFFAVAALKAHLACYPGRSSLFALAMGLVAKVRTDPQEF